jgi:hypothetical protein
MLVKLHYAGYGTQARLGTLGYAGKASQVGIYRPYSVG